MEQQERTKALGTEPVGRLLMQYAVPAIIAMTASSLYNMVDSIFIGQGVGPRAISGLAVTFPFMNLSAAFGAAVGVGSSTLLSLKLGQKDFVAAERILGNSITLSVIMGLLVSLVSILFMRPILMFFGASEATLPYAYDYMLVIMAGNVFSHLYFGMNAILRSAGMPRYAMGATIFTVIVNSILDPLFIWPLGLGIRGAAYATVLSQVLALIWQFYLLSRRGHVVRLRRGIYRLRRDLVKNIAAIGLSPFCMNVMACLVVILINNSLVGYGGDMAVGAYGIVAKISFLFVMIAFGVNQGMQPIAGYNYGAGRIDRMLEVLKLSLIGVSAIMTVGFVVGEFFPHACARLFSDDETLTEHAVHGLRLTMLLYPVVGIQIVVANFFQSIGKSRVSIFLSLSRQLIFLVPMLVILPRFFDVTGVWASMPVADGLSTIVASSVLWYHMRKFKQQQNTSLYGRE